MQTTETTNSIEYALHAHAQRVNGMRSKYIIVNDNENEK